MTDYSRREFLKHIGAVTALFLTSRTAYSLPELLFSDVAKDFEMLVVGDSLVSGQGLQEKDRFVFITRDWLQNEIFGGLRKVNLKTKAHAGARLFLHENEIKAMSDAEKALDEFYYREINVSFPSIKMQIDIAEKEYVAEGKDTKDIDLIILSGGIADLNTSYIINPYNKKKSLRKKITKYCNEWMFRLLQHTEKAFPNALIAVVGYYPFVSKKSSTAHIYNAILEIYNFPRFIKPVMNNILTKQFFKIIHNKISKRSSLWGSESNRELQNAISKFNEQSGKQKALFIKAPITEETCIGTKKPLLWGITKDGRSEDDFYEERKVECKKAIESLKDVKLKFKTRVCELSSVGHPNVEGSKAYAEVIKKILKVKLEQY